VTSVAFAAQFWPQATEWPNLRDAGVAADAAGWDSLWTWDHLLAVVGPWDQPIFEGWLTLGAWAALTSRARLGLLVGANTFRNPGLTAKLAATLDHISGGRAVLGIGAAWFEREHVAFGLDFGASPGQRLDWLDESVALIRRLLDGERVTQSGPRYRLEDALSVPMPLQAHLPIVIGGSGRRKTLRIVARHADGWNTNGTLSAVRDDLTALEAHCAEVGRDPTAIERSVSFPVIIRDSVDAAEARLDEQRARNQTAELEEVPPLCGPPELIADGLRPYVELGFRTIVVRLPAPFDRETLDRIGEVRVLLGAPSAASAA
jgi:alkanesulfonate monooxygenase SsuD/methylene tetrahydromethanopterin reductase-like flavin-dependent oxidoreductase (luciferase family)